MKKRELEDEILWLRILCSRAYLTIVSGQTFFPDLLDHLDNAAVGYTMKESLEDIRERQL